MLYKPNLAILKVWSTDIALVQLQARMLEYLVPKQRDAGQIRFNTVSVDNASQVAPTLKQHYIASTDYCFSG